ncbi:MAG: ankyrin repeat domain-containing protein [Vicinamibacterales bacterium]
MTLKPPTRAMREHPDLDQLKRQAKELLDRYGAGDADAAAEVDAWHRTATRETFALHDAQFVLARAYGFESWPKLKARVDGVTAARLHEAAENGDLDSARALLTRRPEIVDIGRGEMRALHMAVLGRDLAMAKLLLEFGANPDEGIWPKRDATSAFVLARDREYPEIVQAFAEAASRAGHARALQITPAMRALHRAHTGGDQDAVVAVLDANPELANLCGADGVTMLHQAAGWGLTKVMRWSIERERQKDGPGMPGRYTSALINRKSAKGWTSLDFAATGQFGPWEFDNVCFTNVADLLLAHGAELSPLSAATLGRWDFLSARSKQDLEATGVLEAAVKGNHVDVLQRLLDLGLDPDEPTPIDDGEGQIWSAGGPLFQCVVLNRLHMARLLLARGANPNAGVWTAGSPAFRAYSNGNPEMIALMEAHGGWIDAGSAGYARQVEIARKMLAGEIDPHLSPDDSSGQAVAEQLLWGGASSLSAPIVRMALDRVDWKPDDPRWFWILFRPVPGHEDYNAQQQRESAECFALILARCGPHHRAADYGQTMLHEVISRDHGVGVTLATQLLDAGARLDVRDTLLRSTPLGWACRWGRGELVKLLLARGADATEADAEPWATPRAWATKMQRPEIGALLEDA